MPRQVLDGSIQEWVNLQTMHVDMVSSWESLCDTYDTLRFSDPLTDDERLDEYKWITQQMNSFLTKARTKLMSCVDKEAMIQALGEMMIPSSGMNPTTRKALVYQKLRRSWIRNQVHALTLMIEMEEEQDG